MTYYRNAIVRVLIGLIPAVPAFAVDCSLPIGSCTGAGCGFRIQMAQNFSQHVETLPARIQLPSNLCLSGTGSTDQIGGNVGPGLSLTKFPLVSIDQTSSTGGFSAQNYNMNISQEQNKIPTDVSFTYTGWVEQHPPNCQPGNTPPGGTYVSYSSDKGYPALGQSCATKSRTSTCPGDGSSIYSPPPLSYSTCTDIPGLNGACGSANGGNFYSAPASNLCADGSIPAVATSGTSYTWSCVGQSGGTTANCSAGQSIDCAGSWSACSAGSQTYSITSTQQNGGLSCPYSNGATQSCGTPAVCGPANGSAVSSAPTANLCSSGTASAVTGTGPWNWSCTSADGGSTTSCSATTDGPYCWSLMASYVSTYNKNSCGGMSGSCNTPGATANGKCALLSDSTVLNYPSGSIGVPSFECVSTSNARCIGSTISTWPATPDSTTTVSDDYWMESGPYNATCTDQAAALTHAATTGDPYGTNAFCQYCSMPSQVGNYSTCLVVQRTAGVPPTGTCNSGEVLYIFNGSANQGSWGGYNCENNYQDCVWQTGTMDYDVYRCP